MSGPVREAFEAWSEMFCLALDRRPTGTYESMHTHDAWCAYAAGRAAGMEEAAKVCESMTKDIVCPEECAAAIRALAEGKAPPEGPL